MGMIHNPAVYPPDGYFYKQGNVRLKAGSLSALASAVKDYRIHNRIEVGNPLQDVNDFTCARYPTGCSELKKYSMPDPQAKARVPGTIATSTSKWLTDLYRALLSASGTLRVGQTEASRRAAICLACPKQVGWGTGCGGCDASSKRLAFAIRQGKEAAGGEKLLACGLLREDTRTSVWIEGLRPIESAALPENCWRKKT